jgi:hypothetical protein
MKRTFVVVLVLAVVFGGLRVYGAYQHEQQAALDRATKAEARMSLLQDEADRLENQQKCNSLWLEYELAVSKKRLAESEGRFVSTPAEPYCTGYSPRLDQAMNDSMQILDKRLESIAMQSYVKYEKNYATNRPLQTKYLGLRLWAFLTGTEIKQTPAEMEKVQENAANLSLCVKQAQVKGDHKLEASCKEWYGKS